LEYPTGPQESNSGSDVARVYRRPAPLGDRGPVRSDRTAMKSSKPLMVRLDSSSASSRLVKESRLFRRSELRTKFPGATPIPERFCGLDKARFMIVRIPMDRSIPAYRARQGD
jgi:hypothetical protein